MMDLADLHTHTIHSDGLYTPEEVVAAAAAAGLRALGVTDHDSVLGLPAAVAAGARAGIEVIAGV
jgi:predicted metal-dependent phosphoesterase TrpH